jgi:hypothetical protein
MDFLNNCCPYLRRPAPSEQLLAQAQFLAELYGIDTPMPWEPLRISVEHASGMGIRETYDALVHGANYPVRQPEHWPLSPLCGAQDLHADSGGIAHG